MATSLKPETMLPNDLAPPDHPGLFSKTTIRAIIAGILLSIGFRSILVSIYGSWFDPGLFMEHGILVGPAAAYMAWIKRDRLKQVPVQPSAWGFLVVVCGALQAALGVLTHWIWVSRASFLVSLVGCIALVYGWPMIRELVYPLCTLILMIAPPTLLLARLTLSLQLLAGSLGERFLELFGYPVLREGSVIEMVGIKLSVEEVCSGVYALMAVFFMATLYNYFFVKGNVMRLLILLLSVPIAILGNAARMVAAGMAGQSDPWSPTGGLSQPFGYVTVTIATLGCMAMHIIMLSIQRLWRYRRA
ncbi:MAG TPA: exosortase/archaeosortase family protein [Bryobacteraceae bacterium]|nr:exosortase/archaeosortase family protein [Bryobacteraceae bacterium]